MKLKQMLLASTAAIVLSAPGAPLLAATGQDAPIRLAQAAPPALAGAIQTYREAQSGVQAAEAAGEDPAAAQARLAETRAELEGLCAAIGQPDVEACIAFFAEGGAAAQPAPEEVQPEPEMQAEPEPAPEPEPEPEPAPEPQPEPEPAPEPEPEQAPAPVEEPAPEPAPQAEPEQPADQPEQAPEAEVQAQPEQAPEPEPEMDVEPQPEAEMAVEAEGEADVETQPEADQQAEPAPSGQEVAQNLQLAYDRYTAAIAQYRETRDAGGNISDAIAEIGAAEAEVAEICSILGQEDIVACGAAFGLDIELFDPEQEGAVEGTDEADAAEASEDQTPDQAGGESADGEMVDGSEETMLAEDILGELLPEGVMVDREELAPLLDSDKDTRSGSVSEEEEYDIPEDERTTMQAEEDEAMAASEREPEAAPQSDAEAQPEVAPEQIQSARAEEGRRREPRRREDGSVLVGPVESEQLSNAQIITTIGAAAVLAIGANYFIQSQDSERIVYEDDSDYWVEDLPGGRTRETVFRADGSQIVTVRDRYGEIVRRSRIEPDGREFLLVYVDDDYRRYDDQGRWIDPGRQLPPLRLNIPAREYVLDASAADEGQVAQFLDQPPVERIQRYYTVEEVKRSSRVRDMVRRLEIGDLTFATASANIAPDQVNALSEVANAMLDLLQQNPAETFLIEGHTDAVGDEFYNLNLSNERAESVAYALTRVYGIPAENLATQGYGERYLKVNTSIAERVNRRVTIRRITPLVTPVATAN
ncbi:OmpA family protein [Pelagibacterium montanilacus]|uniref:OmpA family protein n=1 Tax=Pelagibacterium montanilacus TaxID=2185280 RepID=UPI000F8F7E83|nr:OmpA family protein [Pelagibacterium montanilacus]